MSTLILRLSMAYVRLGKLLWLLDCLRKWKRQAAS